jgi:hypothetical protein
LLLDDLENLKYELINATTHISNGYIAPPWEELAYNDDNVTILLKEIERKNQMEKLLKNIPWENYKIISKTAGTLLTNVISFYSTFFQSIETLLHIFIFMISVGNRAVK